MKVGLLCGREYSFPARVHRSGQHARPRPRHHRGDGHADRHEDGRAVRVPRHRRPHLARGRVLPRVPEARRARGDLRHQQPVLVDGRRQVLQLRRGAEDRGRGAEDGRAAAEVLSGRHRPDVRIAAQPRLPHRLGRPARLRRPAGDPEAVLRRRLEARLQGPRQGRAARRLRRHRPVLHDAPAVHQLRSVRPLLHVRQDRHHAGPLRRARAQVPGRARVSRRRISARASSRTRRR